MLSNTSYTTDYMPEVYNMPQATESFVYCLLEWYPFSPYSILLYPSNDAIVFRYYPIIPDDTSQPHSIVGKTVVLFNPSLDMIRELDFRGGAELIAGLKFYCCNNETMRSVALDGSDEDKMYLTILILGSLYDN